MSLTGHVQLSDRPDECKLHYLKNVLIKLWMVSEFYFEEDLPLKFPAQPTPSFQDQNSNFISWGQAQNPKKNNELMPVFFDLMSPLQIEREEALFDVFFAHMLAHLDLLAIDQFLDYQLERSFRGDVRAFARFLRLLVRKHKDVVVSEDAALTTLEWIDIWEKRPVPENSGSDSLIVRRKAIAQRKQDDGMTTLSQEQTVLLIALLQNQKVFFRGEHLTDANAGKAFEILTGYSHNTIRQNLSRYTQLFTRYNLEALRKLATAILQVVEDGLGQTRLGTKKITA